MMRNDFLMIDANSSESVSDALINLLEKYQGNFFERGRAAFGISHQSDVTTVSPFFSFSGMTEAEVTQIRLETYGFIKQVLGFANDPSASIVYDKHGKPKEIKSSVSLHQLAVGIQKMNGALDREHYRGQVL